MKIPLSWNLGEDMLDCLSHFFLKIFKQLNNSAIYQQEKLFKDSTNMVTNV